MLINEIREENDILLEIEGRVDTTTAPQLQSAILLGFQKMNHVNIDFAKVEYVSSAGLRALLLGHKTATSKGGKMQLFHVAPVIMDVFNMTGFSNILNIE